MAKHRGTCCRTSAVTSSNVCPPPSTSCGSLSHTPPPTPPFSCKFLERNANQDFFFLTELDREKDSSPYLAQILQWVTGFGFRFCAFDLFRIHFVLKKKSLPMWKYIVSMKQAQSIISFWISWVLYLTWKDISYQRNTGNWNPKRAIWGSYHFHLWIYTFKSP